MAAREHTVRWAKIFKLRFRSLFRRDRAEQELAEELQAHLEEQTAAFFRAGMSATEARRRALVEFGGVEQMKEECREARGVSWIENRLRDAQFSFRLWRNSPGFALAAVLTLALGIGANTAIFSVVNAVLLRPLPYADPGRLVQFTETRHHQREISISYLDFRDWQQQARSFAQIAAFRTASFNLTGAGDPERLLGKQVSANFLSTLGIKPFLGRDVLPAEDRPGGEPVVLLGYRLWRDRFGSDPSLIGKTLTFDGRAYTVIGVLPADQELPVSGEILTPIGLDADAFADRNSHPGIYGFGRMNPGVSLDKARVEMDAIAARLAQTYPNSNGGVGVNLISLRETFIEDLRTPLLVLMAAVSLVLLIACFNVANLQLARAASRENEFAVRRAIGASRGRILGQLLTESLLLSLLGAALGVLLANWMVASLAGLLPPGVARVAPVKLDSGVLLFTTVIAALCGILFGLAPALHASRGPFPDKLKESGRTTTAGARRGVSRQILIVSEVALSLILLLSAGLMIRSLGRLREVNPGFDTHNVLTMKIGLPDSRYPTDESAVRFFTQLVERTRQLPGVQSAALVTPLPLSGDGWQDGFYLEGEPEPTPGNLHSSDFHKVSPGYFQTMGIPLRGRDFTLGDDASAPPVAIVSEGMARRYWPGEDPIGKRFHKGHPGSPLAAWLTVVGVAGDTKQYGLETETKSEFYIPFLREPLKGMTLVMRTESNPLGQVDAAKSAVQAADRSQPVYAVQTLDQLLEASSATRQTSSFLLGVFAAIALALVAIGIYGVMSYSVAERTHEVGVRMALGAQPGDVLRLLMGQGLRLAVLGITLGLTGAFAAAPVLKRVLFGVSPTDASTFTLAPLFLVSVALLACYIPTRRATRVDPMTALRYE